MYDACIHVCMYVQLCTYVCILCVCQGRLNVLKVVGAHLINKTNFYGKKLNSYGQLIKVVGAMPPVPPWFRRLWCMYVYTMDIHTYMGCMMYVYVYKNSIINLHLKAEVVENTYRAGAGGLNYSVTRKFKFKCLVKDFCFATNMLEVLIYRRGCCIFSFTLACNLKLGSSEENYARYLVKDGESQGFRYIMLNNMYVRFL